MNACIYNLIIYTNTKETILERADSMDGWSSLSRYGRAQPV